MIAYDVQFTEPGPTAIGDTTNTAARLEGMTKGQPYVLFMSNATKEALTSPADDLVFVDEFEVRGAREPSRSGRSRPRTSTRSRGS